jgi:KaiC/GvpD/RAD55 family RecA-like ATPase
MVIKSIEEIQNPNIPEMSPITEIMDINVPNISDAIPNRNGNIWVLTGSGGSGKTSLLLNFFKSKQLYLRKFNNVFYICPESSFLSVKDHVFSEHNKVYHDLTDSLLYEIYDTLLKLKQDRAKKKKAHYNIIILDDQADVLKNKHIQTALNKMLIKARHLNCSFVFTLQSYFYYPKILRKQITYITIFRPRSLAEFETLASELFNMGRDDAIKLFNFVFDEPYNHLDVNTINSKYYKNFNELILTE